MHIERVITPSLRAWRMLSCASMLAVSGAIFAAPPQGTTTLVFELSRGGLQLAEMTDVLQADAGSYQFASNAKGVGVVALLARGQSLRRESRGAIGAEGLVPRSFTEQRGDKYKVSAEFDWPAREVMLTDALGEISREPVVPRAQDRLSMIYQLAFSRDRPPAEFSVQVADGRHLSDYTFRLVGTENVATGIGEVKALHYAKVLSGNDTAFDFWLGIEHRLLPVRVSYADKDGTRFEQSLRSIQPARL